MKAWIAVLGLSLAALGAGGVGYWLGHRPSAAPPPAPRTAQPAPVVVFERREAPTARTYEGPLVAAPTGSRWAELNREAIAALENGELERAVELFAQCVDGAPEEAVFQHNLAEGLVRRALQRHEIERPCPDCVAWLSRAVELAPDREPIRVLLERWRAEAETERDFWREGSQHFDLSYDGWRDEILSSANEILLELERTWGELALQFGVYPGEGRALRIPVVLYRPAEFRAVTGLGHWAGGAFDGAIRVPIEEGRVLDPQLAELLRHELVHVFVRTAGGASVPGWLNEGLAQWLQVDRESDLRAAREKLKQVELLPLERLQGSLGSLDGNDEIARAYAQSLLFCDWIANTYGHATLFRMVAGCLGGTSPAATFQDWIRVPLADAARDFAATLAR